MKRKHLVNREKSEEELQMEGILLSTTPFEHAPPREKEKLESRGIIRTYWNTASRAGADEELRRVALEKGITHVYGVTYLPFERWEPQRHAHKETRYEAQAEGYSLLED